MWSERYAAPGARAHTRHTALATHTTKRRIRGYELTLLQTNKQISQSDKTDAAHTRAWSRSETDAGRTDGHDRHHRHSTRSPRPCNAQANTPRTHRSAASTPAARRASPLSALSTDPCSTHARRHPGQSNVERGSSAQAGRSVGLVGEMRPARCCAGSIATASSPPGALSSCTGRGRRCRAAAARA